MRSVVTDLRRYPRQFHLPQPTNGEIGDQQIHQNDGINGAILVGYISYASWELPWGETTSLPLFYEDLDGVFLDMDSDGFYDYHDWGPNTGVEMWVSWIRPPTSNPIDFLQAYFDKLHNYYIDDNLNYKTPG